MPPKNPKDPKPIFEHRADEGTLHVGIDQDNGDLILLAQAGTGYLRTESSMRVPAEDIAALHAALGIALDEQVANEATKPVLRARFLSEAATRDTRIGLYDETGQLVHVDGPHSPFILARNRSYPAVAGALLVAGYRPLLVTGSAGDLDAEYAARVDTDDPHFAVLVKRVGR